MLCFILVGSVMSVLFVSFSHPIMMVFSIVMSVIIMVALMNLWTMMVWLGYIIILVFLGGMMILFMYISSLSSNEPIFGGFGGGIMMIMLMVIWGDEWAGLEHYMMSVGAETELFLSLGYLEFMLLFIFMMVYMFFVLFLVVEISSVKIGSLSVSCDN